MTRWPKQGRDWAVKLEFNSKFPKAERVTRLREKFPCESRGLA